MLRTLIVDDNPDFLDRVRKHLADVEMIKIIGEAENGQEAIEKALDLEPDLILMDVDMGDISGLEATEQVLELLPDVSIIILSRYDLHEYREAAKIRGAYGYVVKMNMTHELLPSIQGVIDEQEL